MTALIVMLPLIVVVEMSLQLHRSVSVKRGKTTMIYTCWGLGYYGLALKPISHLKV
jgi:hypothetical protein